MTQVYLNGEFREEAEACIPVWDRGVLFGDGLFETLRAYQGVAFGLPEHLARMRDSALLLQIPMPWEEEREAERIIAELLERNGLAGPGAADAYIRITLTGGRHGGGLGLQRPGPSTVFIVARPFEGFPESWYRHGLRLIVSGIRRNSGSPITRMKTINGLDSLLARQEALDAGAQEALFLDSRGFLSEGTSSNFFFAWGEKLCTPSLECGALPGMARTLITGRLCPQLGVPVEEGEFTLEDLETSSEAFISNSLREIVPVSEVDGVVSHGEVPGPLTARLAAAYSALTAA